MENCALLVFPSPEELHRFTAQYRGDWYQLGNILIMEGDPADDNLSLPGPLHQAARLLKRHPKWLNQHAITGKTC
ncbi:MAG TPA: hypothetical protein VHA30_00405 [Patescibacteria group bacterium]|nr:hypothetical protein [Patescibacteria group bacterium]